MSILYFKSTITPYLTRCVLNTYELLNEVFYKVLSDRASEMLEVKQMAFKYFTSIEIDFELSKDHTFGCLFSGSEKQL